MSEIDVEAGPARAVWSDCELVDAVRAGDDDAYEELYRRHRRRVVGYVRAILGDRGGAEDVTQDAFISGLQGLRLTRAEVAFKPWIFAIARNACIDLLRRARLEPVPNDRNGGNGTALAEVPAEAPDAELARRESLDHLVAALGELTQRHRSVLIMRELEGLSAQEIAKRAGLTRPAVESALFRARRELRETYAALEAGTRCREMTVAIASLAKGVGSRRERRRVERHARHCAACRRRARRLGVELRPGAGLLAALLPWPWMLTWRGGGSPGGSPARELVARLERGRGWITAAPQTSDAVGTGLAQVAAVVAATALIGGSGERDVSGDAQRLPAVADERPAASAARDATARATGPARPETQIRGVPGRVRALGGATNEAPGGGSLGSTPPTVDPTGRPPADLPIDDPGDGQPDVPGLPLDGGSAPLELPLMGPPPVPPQLEPPLNPEAELPGPKEAVPGPTSGR